jgi:hypothetical protein
MRAAMRLEVFGKPGCAKCKSAKEKLKHLLDKSNLSTSVAMEFFDLESVDGMAEGAFNDVHDLPTIILRDDSGQSKARWNGTLPLSTEVLGHLGAVKGVGAVE